jgi:hypothetical protein
MSSVMSALDSPDSTTTSGGGNFLNTRSGGGSSSSRIVRDPPESPFGGPRRSSPACDDGYWSDLAYNMMSFKLGVHPERLDARVGRSSATCDIVVHNMDAMRAYEQVVREATEWAERARLTPKGKRASLTSVVPLHSGGVEPTLAELKHSPKMFVTPESDDTEVRVFVGVSESGVPLMRLVLIRSSESSTRTAAVSVTGIIIHRFDCASEQLIGEMSESYTQWVIKELVRTLIKLYDFVRVSTKFAESMRDVVETLVAQGLLEYHNKRYIVYSTRRFSRSPRINALPLMNTVDARV